MINLQYPYPTYVPNKTAAGCLAAVVGISLIAWFIQSCQTRFQPRRISIILLISHMAICAELIIHAAVNDEQNSRTLFSITNSLFVISQRMMIVANFSFVLEIHYEKTRLARGIFICALLCIVTSAVLMITANIYTFEPDQINTSFLFRKLSASVLLIVTLLFYLILYWSRTIQDMTMQAIALIIVSSTLCLAVTVFTLIQSISIYYYEEINKQEEWFYGFQIVPIILAHYTWSIFHPKRSLKPSKSSTSETVGAMILDNQQF